MFLLRFFHRKFHPKQWKLTRWNLNFRQKWWNQTLNESDANGGCWHWGVHICDVLVPWQTNVKRKWTKHQTTTWNFDEKSTIWGRWRRSSNARCHGVRHDTSRLLAAKNAPNTHPKFDSPTHFGVFMKSTYPFHKCAVQMRCVLTRKHENKSHGHRRPETPRSVLCLASSGRCFNVHSTAHRMFWRPVESVKPRPTKLTNGQQALKSCCVCVWRT